MTRGGAADSRVRCGHVADSGGKRGAVGRRAGTQQKQTRRSGSAGRHGRCEKGRKGRCNVRLLPAGLAAHAATNCDKCRQPSISLNLTPRPAWHIKFPCTSPAVITRRRAHQGRVRTTSSCSSTVCGPPALVARPLEECGRGPESYSWASSGDTDTPTRTARS